MILLKGLIFCHECGYPMAVLNRKNAAGEDRLFFVCQTYLNPDRLRPIAQKAVEKANKVSSCEAEMQEPQSKITALTTNLDQMYMDRLNGLLSEEDFQRIYQKVRMDRTVLQDRLKNFQEQAKQQEHPGRSENAGRKKERRSRTIDGRTLMKSTFFSYDEKEASFRNKSRKISSLFKRLTLRIR